MPTSPYTDGIGTPRNRSLASGDGTTGDPDIANFAPKYLNDAPITGATMPAGGVGVIGWLSGIWKFLNDRLTSLGQKTSANSMPMVIASDQSAIPISGSITATNPSVSATGAAIPASGTLASASDGTNLLALRATTSAPAGTEAGLIVRSISDLGLAADSAASSDTGTFSLIALTKKALQSLTSLITIFTRPTIIYISSTVATIGDNSIISAPGSGLSIYVTHLLIQNESATATTIILKDSSDRLRCLGQSQGDGITFNFSERRELKLATNTALTLNLSGANSCGYSIGYYTA